MSLFQLISALSPDSLDSEAYKRKGGAVGPWEADFEMEISEMEIRMLLVLTFVDRKGEGKKQDWEGEKDVFFAYLSALVPLFHSLCYIWLHLDIG